MRTLVIQSHRTPLPYPWLSECINSVQAWSESNHYQYQFIDDALFDLVPDEVLTKTSSKKIIATDIARLLILQSALRKEFDRAVWFDADFLIFSPSRLKLPKNSFSVGREVWVQLNKSSKLKTYTKVHNAFLMFQRSNNFLDFYIDSATRMILKNQGSMPPQFVGPKLLTALHNIVQLPVLETAGMLSPLVIQDIVKGEGPALDKFKRNSLKPIAGANLCCSSVSAAHISSQQMDELILRLLNDDRIFW